MAAEKTVKIIQSTGPNYGNVMMPDRRTAAAGGRPIGRMDVTGLSRRFPSAVPRTSGRDIVRLLEEGPYVVRPLDACGSLVHLAYIYI